MQWLIPDIIVVPVANPTSSRDTVDVLTTSDTAGRAMKVRDYSAAQGAIIAKAKISFETRSGMVLVNLQ